jgi:hypothetical protein
VSVEEWLVRLYPTAVRRVWGADLQAEARAAGWRSWPDLARGAADMWLHPATWPARLPAQRRGRIGTLAVTLGLTGWLIGHAVAEQDLRLATVGHGLIQIGSAMLLLGLVLVAPRPRASVATCVRAARLLAPSALLGAAVVAVANLDNAAALPAPVRAVILTCWWAALGTGALNVCRLVAAIQTVAVAPSPTRLRAGLLILATALIGGAVVPLSAGPSMPAVLGAGGLLLTAAGCVANLRDPIEARP